MDPFVSLYVSIGLVVGLVWIYQFIQLMLLSDADFPGKYDKALWVAAFVFALPLAPFAFLWWKSAYQSMLGTRRPRDDEHV